MTVVGRCVWSGLISGEKEFVIVGVIQRRVSCFVRVMTMAFSKEEEYEFGII